MSLVIYKLAETKIIKPLIELPKNPIEYKRLYLEHIGLKGNVIVRQKINGKRVMWNGNFFTDKHTLPVHVDKSIIDNMPGNMTLDGILVNFSMDYRKPTKWSEVKFIPIDIPNSKVNYKQRINNLRRIKSSVINIPVFHLINSIESNWNKVNELYIEGEEKGLIINMADEIKYGNIYEYSFGKIGEATIIDFIEGVNNFKGILGKYKCLTKGGNVFYLSNNIPNTIRESYKFTGGICTYKEKGSPNKGDMLFFDTPSFINPDIPSNPSFLLTSFTPT